MQLPSVREAVIQRPGPYKDTVRHDVPNPEYVEFWQHWYQTFRRMFDITPPVKATEDLVDPLFGNFGLRYHPVIHRPGYFHAGIDITVKPKTNVFPLLPGVLEYSGFGVVNGNYVLMSHPSVTTEDGYMLYTAVMHLKQTRVGFSSYQKMLREISLHNYPRIEVRTDHPIGVAGNSGIANGYHTHVHVQCELRNKKTKDIILLDPAALFGFESRTNISAVIKNRKQFNALQTSHPKIISQFKMGKYWKD